MLNNNIYFKKITDFCGVLDENQYIKVENEISKKSIHYHLFKDNELIGILLLSNQDRAYFIEKIWIKENRYLIPFVFALYREISEKINPISFNVKQNKYIKEFKKMHFSQKERGSYRLDMNPRNLDQILKKDNLI